MRKLTTVSIVFLCSLWMMLLSGCVFVNVHSIFPSPSRLEEKTIGGEGKEKILLMDISGTISDKDETNALGMVTQMNPVARVREELDMALKDEKIKALLLKINSPGGTVTASDIIFHELKTFKEKKNIPIIVSMMDLAASGGYYIAMAADKIIAHPTTITGSIGVIMIKFNIQGLMKKIGIQEVSIKSGAKKDILSIFKQLSEEEQTILQNIIDEFYDRFIEIIADARPALSREKLKKIADGRIYTARQALELKLIDGIGYLDECIELAKKEAGIKQAKIILYQRPSQYRNNIYGKIPKSGYLTDSNFFEGLSPQFYYLWKPL